MRSRSLCVTTSDGFRLEATLEVPAGTGPWPGVVLAHPHPFYGGTKDVPLLVALADGLTRHGFATLRFNFRGVGRSEGRFFPDERAVADVAAAFAALLEQPDVDADRCGLAGYSFGAWVGLRHFVKERRLRAFVAVGMPLWDQSPAWFRDDGRPRLFVTGSLDDISPADALTPLLVGAEHAHLEVIPGADHFYRPPHQEAVVSTTVAFLAEALASPERP